MLFCYSAYSQLCLLTDEHGGLYIRMSCHHVYILLNPFLSLFSKLSWNLLPVDQTRFYCNPLFLHLYLDKLNTENNSFNFERFLWDYRLWCRIEKYQGGLCSDCPLEILSILPNNQPCKLWEELRHLQVWQITE